MQLLKLPLCIGLLLQQSWLLVTAASASVHPTAHSIVFQTESTPSSSVIQAADIRVRRSRSLFRQKRQSRCVACYEDRRRHGQHSGSTADDGNWYQPGIRNYNRYHDRSLGGERDYERFDSYYDYNRDRNNDYIPRTYDRYEEPRYDDRLGSYAGRGQRRDYGYDTRAPYFGPDRYTGVKTSDKFDVPAYERNYGNRYDFRNYRPRDETYRGQSGLDSSAHGYYFSSNKGSRPGLDTSLHGQSWPMREPSLLPYGRPVGNPCRVQVSKCPYDENFASSGSLSSTAAASYQTVHSGRDRGSGTSVSSSHKGSGWSYLDERESGDGEIDRDRSTEGNTQRFLLLSPLLALPTVGHDGH